MDNSYDKNKLVSSERLDEVRDYLESIIAHVPGHIYWKDLNCRFLGCNDLQAKTAGLSSRRDIVGLSSLDIITKNQSEAERIKQANAIDSIDKMVMETNEAIALEEPLKLEDGSERVFFSHKVPLHNKANQVIGILGISVDITPQKEAEKQILIAKERAEAANKIKEDFLYNMRHDIRTPFTGIITLAQLMADEETNTEKKEHLNIIADSANVLLTYMNEILEHAQIEYNENTVAQKRVNLESLVQECLLTIAPGAEAKDIRLTQYYAYNVPPIVISDKLRLQRILINLLSNAIKFTHAGYIEVSVDLKEQDKENIIVEISVRDSGIGIPESKREEIFEKFTRLEAAHKGGYQGMGLGLHDVRQLCQELNGRITVSDNQGKGSVFTCVLPFIIPDNATKKAATKEYTPDKEKNTYHFNILLVEDSPIVALATSRMLAAYGYNVDIAETGKLALEKFNSQVYDIILMDIGLPDIDGITVSHRIRDTEKSSNKTKTPIVAITAHKDKSADEMKIFDYVYIKPFTSRMADILYENFFKKNH